jgi:RimJ/RimL family protein N-acetyltransferase
VIADRDRDAALGALYVHSVDRHHRRCELGFFLVPAARGRGLASEALELLIGWLFGEGGFERVEMTTTPDNDAVFRIAERLGFAHEGTLRSRNLERGRRVDVAWFGLLAP